MEMEYLLFAFLFFRSVVGMSDPTVKKAKLRNYREYFIMLGFVSVDSKPMCLE